ncbi:MAG: hypothetical protein RIR27_646, partial [Pseudomonadota bacterium]
MRTDYQPMHESLHLPFAELTQKL